jgi:hypothetical protein
MKPKRAAEGLRWLADWFDAKYHDAGQNDEVQQDLRRWAGEFEAAEGLLARCKQVLLDVEDSGEVHLDEYGPSRTCPCCSEYLGDLPRGSAKHADGCELAAVLSALAAEAAAKETP